MPPWFSLGKGERALGPPRRPHARGVKRNLSPVAPLLDAWWAVGQAGHVTADGARRAPTAHGSEECGAGEARDGGILELCLPGSQPVPLRFVRLDGIVYVLSTATRSPWVSHLLAQGGALVRVGSTIQPHASSVVIDTEGRSRVLSRFREVHGDELMTRYFDRPLRVVALRPDHAYEPAGYPERVRWEFDSVAPEYTESNLRDPLEAHLKARSRSRILSYFSGGGRVLEVGPGTGLETIPLLSTGTRVIAVDVSSGMLERLRSRAEAAGVEGSLETREGSLGDLGRVLGDLAGGSLHGAYTTYGAFNLEEDLHGLGRVLGRMIRPGGRFFVASLNRLGVAPWVYALAEGRFREIRDRLRSPIPSGPVGYPLEVYPRGPALCRSLLSPEFLLEKVEAATLLAPPRFSPRMHRWLGRRSLQRLVRFDEWLSEHWPGSWLGEWEFLTFRRVGGSSRGETGIPAPPERPR